jgi:hypothetical protein
VPKKCHIFYFLAASAAILLTDLIKDIIFSLKKLDLVSVVCLGEQIHAIFSFMPPRDDMKFLGIS